MSMRYLIRRPKPEDLTDIKREIANLEAKLDKPLENYRRSVEVNYSPLRSALYQFQTRKSGTGWTWICPSIEIVAENEEGLAAMTEKFKVPRPSHLA
jgi:hypothetical protein